MADIPILVCTHGALAGQRIEVPEGGLGMGRSEENEVVITDEGVSRFHVRLLYDQGQLWVQDSGSRNGVFVNGNRLTNHHALKVGDEIAVAEHTFTVQWRDDEVTLATEIPEPEQTEEPPSTEKKWWWPFS